MSYSSSEKSTEATVLLMAELKTSLYHLARAGALLAGLPNQHYLVSVQPALPPFYYHIPCIASAWEHEREKARQELLSFGADLEIAPENCLLLSQSGSFFQKIRLKRELERQLKCSVRFLSLADNQPRVTLPVATLATRARRPLVRNSPVHNPVKIRTLTRSSVLY